MPKKVIKNAEELAKAFEAQEYEKKKRKEEQDALRLAEAIVFLRGAHPDQFELIVNIFRNELNILAEHYDKSNEESLFYKIQGQRILCKKIIRLLTSGVTKD